MDKTDLASSSPTARMSTDMERGLVPVSDTLFHQWCCGSGQYAKTFISGVLSSPGEAGQWLHTALSRRYVKAHQPDKIIQAFKAGELFCRGVNLDEPTTFSKGLETEYQQERVAPRPGTMLQEGRRVNLFSSELHLGLHPTRELYCYKKDVWSTDNTTKDSNPRIILPNRACLLEKIAELDDRLDGLYPLRTSGHLGHDGTHVSGHDKPPMNRDYQLTNETIIEGYRKEQYQCVFIGTPFSLDQLYRQLMVKARLESALSINELPVVFYEPGSGNIREIIYLTDLGIRLDHLPEIKANIDRLKLFVEHSSAFGLESLLSRLPPSRLLGFLQCLPVEVVRTIQQLSTPYRNALLHGVQQVNLAKVKLCQQHGANLAAGYFKGYRYCNLLELLLDANCVKNRASNKEARELKEQTSLGILLYDEGCRVVVDTSLIQKLPSLAIHMLGKGEPFDRKSTSDNPFKWLGDHLAEGIISRKEFETAITCLKRSFSDKPEELNQIFIRYLCEKLNIWNNFFGCPDRLIDIHNSEFAKYSVAEEIGPASAIISLLGISADIALLREYLEATGKKEIRHVENQKEYLEDIIQNKFAIYSVSDLIRINARGFFPDSQGNEFASHVSNGQTGAARTLLQEIYQQKLRQAEAKQKSIATFIQSLEATQDSESARQARAESLASIPGEEYRKGSVQQAGSGENPDLGWLRELYDYAPVTHGKSYRDLAQLAVRHYYRTPHPGQSEKLVWRKDKMPALLREDHGVDHVTRTQILAEALLELFARHDQDYRDMLEAYPGLCELIPLAMVYHDVVAEVEPKAEEEARAAEFFERDIRASGRYPEELVTLVASALRNKNTNTFREVTVPFVADNECSTQERMVRHLLRLPDSIDIIRVLAIPENWTIPSRTRHQAMVFDAGLMDLPGKMLTDPDFRKTFEDLMEGAKNLAYVSGGKPKLDNSSSGSYLSRNNLQDCNQKRQLKVTRAVNSYDSVMSALDDNVRRAMARMAGLSTCQADHSREALEKNHRKASCLTTRQDRQSLSAIHSESELRQVRLPEQMTVLEKLLFEQRGGDCLNPEMRNKVESEVTRLRLHAIQPPLGTLTQDTLQSAKALKRLHEDYNLDVVEAKRFCGYCQDGRKKYTTILEPASLK